MIYEKMTLTTIHRNKFCLTFHFVGIDTINLINRRNLYSEKPEKMFYFQFCLNQFIAKSLETLFIYTHKSYALLFLRNQIRSYTYAFRFEDPKWHNSPDLTLFLYHYKVKSKLRISQKMSCGPELLYKVNNQINSGLKV